MNIVDSINQFRQTKKGYSLFGLVELALLYGFISICIDTANMWVYASSIVLLIVLLRNFYELGLLIRSERLAGRQKKA